MGASEITHKERKPFPALRFKGFDEDWHNKHLKEVLTLITRPLKMEDDQIYSLVTVKRRYEGIVHRGDYKGKDVKVKSQFLLRTNDFLISKRQISHNACGLVPKELNGSIVSNEYSVFLPQKNLDVHYFNYFCRLPKVSKTFFLSSTGVHIEKLIFKVDTWFKWRFAFPSFPEQQKIAAFLSAVDEKIRQLTRKKELLEQYKKGVMQQLFSGKLRFKDENDKAYPKWEEKGLGDVLSVKSGFGFKAHEYSKDGIKLLQIENVSYGKIKWSDNTIYLPTTYLDLYPELHLKENDIVIALNRPVTNNQLKISKINRTDEPSILYQRVGKLVFKKKDISHEFIYQIFNIEVRKFVLTQSIGSDQPFISINSLYKLKILLPSFTEQKKVANFLSAIDVKLENIDKQITQTQTFKKGLLQQMFV